MFRKFGWGGVEYAPLHFCNITSKKPWIIIMNLSLMFDKIISCILRERCFIFSFVDLQMKIDELISRFFSFASFSLLVPFPSWDDHQQTWCRRRTCRTRCRRWPWGPRRRRRDCSWSEACCRRCTIRTSRWVMSSHSPKS